MVEIIKLNLNINVMESNQFIQNLPKRNLAKF